MGLISPALNLSAKGMTLSITNILQYSFLKEKEFLYVPGQKTTNVLMEIKTIEHDIHR